MTPEEYGTLQKQIEDAQAVVTNLVEKKKRYERLEKRIEYMETQREDMLAGVNNICLQITTPNCSCLYIEQPHRKQIAETYTVEIDRLRAEQKAL